MKLTVKVGNLNNLKASIRKRIQDAIKDQSFLRESAEEIVFDIKRSARTGNTIVDGIVKPMVPLKDSTIKNRAQLRKNGNAKGRPYRDEFSNLTVSGQLIDSVGYEIEESTIVIQAKGNREPYRLKDGSRSKASPITNQELSKIHHAGSPQNNLPARPFIGLRDEMKARMLTKLREYIRRSLDVVFKVKKGS